MHILKYNEIYIKKVANKKEGLIMMEFDVMVYFGYEEEMDYDYLPEYEID
ncbi:hypothetical protein GCM10008904_27850 [Paraclostridium ghonii]|uniref:Uncharacterized protein n=1 Tax=Paraclostridium ghonii TaxID=29358 RepID=A0ABU0N3I6_9FIRM|nr:hypothetical protein [Paeniclostridium ghonii]